MKFRDGELDRTGDVGIGDVPCRPAHEQITEMQRVEDDLRRHACVGAAEHNGPRPLRVFRRRSREPAHTAGAKTGVARAQEGQRFGRRSARRRDRIDGGKGRGGGGCSRTNGHGGDAADKC